MSVVLVRHGETEWSRTGRHTGRTDVELTAHGVAQARALVTVLAEWNFTEVRVSPLRRARDTAWLAGFDATTAVIDEDLREWDYGRHEGLTSSEIHQNDPGWTIFADSAPGGEQLDDVERRVDRILDRVRPLHQDGLDVALVAHGHLLRVLGARWLEVSGSFGAHLGLDAASICVLGDEHDVPILQHWNLTTPID